MMRFACFFSLLVLASAVGAAGASAESCLWALVEPPEGSLRGETIDLDDTWDSARLLAYFGEDLGAYELLRRRPPADSRPLEVERFEARLLTDLGLYERADSLLALRPYTADDRERYLHYLWRARLNAKCGRYERALDLVGALESQPDTVFEAYRDLVAVESYLRTREPAAARETAARRLSRGVPPALAFEFETRLLDAYLHEGRPADALDLLEAVKKKPGGRSARAPLAAREVDVRFMLGDTLGAVEAAVGVIEEYGSSSVIAAVDSVLARVPLERLSTGSLLTIGGFLMRFGRTSEADRVVAALGSRPLEPEEKESKRLLSADLLYRQKRYTAAEREIRAAFADPPSERRAKLLRARIYRGAGQRARSAEAYEAFARAYPYDSKAAEALYVAWDMQRESGDATRAAGLLTTIVETYPSNKYARLATLRIAFDHVEKGELTRGARVLEQALERSNRDDESFLYYLSDVYGRMRNLEKKTKMVDELTVLDPFSFYLASEIPSPQSPPPAWLAPGDGGSERGLLEFLSEVLEARLQAYQRVRGAVTQWENWPPAGEAADCLIRGRAFVEMGFGDWAEGEFREAESAGGRPKSADLALAELYDDLAMPWRSVRAVQRVYYALGKETRRGLDSDFKRLTFPLPHPSLVFENCARNGIAPHLVYGMIREESRFDEKAVSPAGAMGLMQIMPSTGRQLAEELGLPEGAHHNLLSPNVNVSFGVWYAARLLELSNQDPLKMLAAYNAGYGNASRWFNDRTAGKTAVERVDGIDFWETREYVKRIVESARIYHSEYFSRRPTP